MAKKRVVGICQLCGTHGELTFEHVPPRAAYNKHPIVLARGEEILRRQGDFDTVRGRIEQKGAGSHTLCARCNNITGKWYGAHYVEWERQGFQILDASGGRPSMVLPFRIRPLSVIKQVVCMFFSAHGDGLRQESPDLVSFVLDRDRRYMDPAYRVYAYFHVSAKARQSGRSVIGQILVGRMWVVSEISFPPIGYVMTFDSECPDKRLVEISRFARYSYGREDTVWLSLPPLEIYTPYPCDYRPKDEVLRTAAESMERERQRREGEAPGG